MKIEKLGKYISEISIRNKFISVTNVFSVTNSQGFVKSTDYFNKEVFSKDISNYKIVSENQFAYNPSRINVGSIDYLKNQTKVIISPLYVVFKCDEDLNEEYLKVYLKSPVGISRIKGKTKGAVRDSVSFGSLCEIKIPIPSITSQIQIATLLSKAEKLIEQRKQCISLLTEFLKSTFLEMFGDAKQNKKGFPICTIEQVSSEIKDGPHVSPKYSEMGIPIFSSRNIKPGELIMDEIKYVSEEMYMDLTKRFRPKINDVLITKGGTTGYAKVVDFDFPFCIWVHIAAIRPTQKIIPLYLEYFINSDYGYYQTQKYTKGAANRDLGLKKIAKIELPLPPIELQCQFAEIAENTIALKALYQSSLHELENLYGSLSQKAFNGKLELR